MMSLLSLIVVVAAVSQESYVEPLRLEGSPKELQGYLLEAGESNPGLQAKYHQWLAAIERISLAEALDDPLFGYSYFLQSDMNEYKLNVSQKFPWFGTIKQRGASASDRAEAALQAFYGQRNEVFADVKQKYYTYRFLAESLRVTEAQLEILSHTEEIVRSKYSLGLAPEDALFRVQIEIAKVRNETERIADLRPSLSANLAESLGRADAEVLPWPEAVPIHSDTPDETTTLERIREHNPNLESYAHLINGQERQVDLARRRRYPNFNVGMEFKEKTQSVSMDDEVMVSVGLSIPVWQKKNRAAVAEARLQQRTLEYERSRVALNLETTSKRALFELKDSVRRYELYQSNLVPQAERTYQSLQSAYAAGRTGSGFLDLLEAVRVLLDFELEKLRAERDMQIAHAELDYLMGTY